MGEKTMPDSQTFEMRMELKGDNDSVQTAIIQFEVSGQDVVKIRGLNPEGEEKYRVSLVVSKNEPQGGCWICLEPPCPPNIPTWFDPCPFDPPEPA
jgi:hypothetical protein